MRYLVTARVKPGRGDALERAIDDRTLGEGSIAGDEYFRNMADARQLDDGRVQWVEVCYCATPLAEERAYWEAFFDLVNVQDAHAPFEAVCALLSHPELTRTDAARASEPPRAARNPMDAE